MINLEPPEVIEPSSIQKIMTNGSAKEVGQQFLLSVAAAVIANTINFSVQHLMGVNAETKNTIDVTPK